MDQWPPGPQVRPAIQVPVTRMGGGAGLCAGGLPGITAQSQVSTQCPGREAGRGPHMRKAGWGAGGIPVSPWKEYLLTGCPCVAFHGTTWQFLVHVFEKNFWKLYKFEYIVFGLMSQYLPRGSFRKVGGEGWKSCVCVCLCKLW